VDLVKARLQGITTAAGYGSNLGEHVEVWKTTKWPHGTALGVNIMDVSCVPTEGEQRVIGQFNWALNMEIHIVAAEGEIPADNARIYIQDILQAIGTDPKWSNNADRTGQPADTMNAMFEGRIIAGVVMNFTIYYRTPKWRQ
jgi:hypothetical protein